jgi:iron complex transport system substrate-binding protein
MKKGIFLAFSAAALCLVYWCIKDHVVINKNSSKNPYIRVVSLAPSFSETMKSLGQTHRLVGVSTDCDKKVFKNIKKIGSFAQINIEAILELKPDLVLAVPHVLAKPILKKLAKHNIEIFAHQPDTIEDIETITRLLAKKFNVNNLGDLVINDIHNSIINAKKDIELLQDNKAKKKFLMTISASPLVVAGKNSFPSQVLEKLGFINSVTMENVAWPIWPLEQILLNPPDIIVFSTGEQNFFQYQHLLNKIHEKTGNIAIIASSKDIFSSPSPKIIKDIKKFTNLIKKEYNRAI